MNKINSWRWGFFMMGLIVIALGVSLTIKGQTFGVGSWDVLHIGLFKNFGFSIGSWSIITGLIIIGVTAIGTRQFPKIGTFINMVSIGIFIDFFNWLLPDVDHLALQFFSFLIGIILIGLGGGMYISANLGAGPRDSLMLLAVDKLGLSITKARTIMEIAVAVAGWLLGGPVGLGTVLMAFGLGPIVQFSLAYSRKLLLKCIGEEQVTFSELTK
ncbi:YitT family protein [Viridibacillus sp. FSL E2-0187]|uniref:YczE/YyaS/YitT family protein n=1 Tax=Viridibacillus TaxID=496496 RepID=UPI0030F5EB03